MKRILLIAFALGLSAQTRPPAPPSPVSKLLRTLLDSANADQAMRDVRTIWETDRWFTFPKFEETAKNVAAMMRRAGLEDVEIESAPADGVTQAGFWTQPLAWDVKTGTLEIVEPAVPADQRVLADYQKVPTSLCMWSGPTPAGGVVTEVVAPAGSIEGVDLKGKLVLGARGSKSALAKAGALGMISENTENRDLVDDRGWVNSFGDNGWSFTKGSSPLVCFSITPRGSQLLRGLLKKGPVKVRANVDSRYYAGVYPYVTGVIRGTDGAGAEEVLSLGHLFEQGAHDNATGVASIIGATEVITRLIKEGKLPRPKRTIRILAMGECYGTMHYLQQHRDRVKRTIAAMCIDSPAGLQNLAGTEYTWILNPHSAKSYVDAFALRLASEYYPMVGRPWRSQEHRSSTDNYLGDPSIGIPTVMPHGGYGVLAHHNSADTPATVDPKSLRDLIVMNAAYSYFLAAAGPGEKRWMAEVALSRGQDQITAAANRVVDEIMAADTAQTLGRLRHQGAERIEYQLAREQQAVRSAAEIGDGLSDFARMQKERVARAVRDRAAALKIEPAPYKPASRPGASEIVVRRKRIGTITLDDLPRERREGWPAASFWGAPVSALYWCDGKRNLAEVIRLTELEMGPQNFDFVGYFRFLEKNGYVEFVQAAAPQATTTQRRVAITIDDGPVVGEMRDLANFQRISRGLLASLEAEKVPATIFVNERQLNVPGQRDGRAAVLSQWLDAGYDLGNHTYSHPSLNRVSLREFQDDVVRGDTIMRPLVEARGKKMMWFRYPFLHSGTTAEVHQGIVDFLEQRQYKVAHVTVDYADYSFAGAFTRLLRAGDGANAERVKRAYLDQVDVGFDHAEKASVEVFGREIPQILLIHCNELNSLTLRESIARMRQRGYTFVTLDEAVQDAAYARPDTFTGPGGSWLSRSARALGKTIGTPAVVFPQWINELSPQR